MLPRMVDHFVSYSGTTAPVRIEGVFRTQADADTHAGTSTELTALQGAITDDNVDVDWFITNLTTRAVQATYPSTEAARKSAIRALAVAHGNRVWDHMRPGWVTRDGGTTFVSENPTEQQRRYRNTYYWIMCATKAVTTVCQDSGWTADQCQEALDAFQSLVPDDPESIHTWYSAHSEAIWRAYFTLSNNAVPGYFGWQRGNATPAFASDAASSTLWNGVAGSANPTFTVARDAIPGSFAEG